jgi:hypothetical protein
MYEMHAIVSSATSWLFISHTGTDTFEVDTGQRREEQQ